MQFTGKQLNDLREIYKKETNKDISDSDLLDMANRLVGLFRILVKENSNHKDNKEQAYSRRNLHRDLTKTAS